MALAGATVVVGTSSEAFAATASHGGYGPPPVPTPAPPGGFASVVTTVTIGPAGGTIGPLTIDGVRVTITIPAGAFPLPVQFTVTAPDLDAIAKQVGTSVLAGVGIQVLLGATAYPGTFLKAATAAFASTQITASSAVVVWNGTSFVTDQDSTSTPGVASVSFDSDPDFAVTAPASTTSTPVAGATTPVTGKPVLGESILAGTLVLAGAGGLVVSRRRRRVGNRVGN